MNAIPADLVAPSAALPVEGGPSKAYRNYVLFAVAFIGFMCAVDKVVISMFMEAIKKDFALSDTQLGALTGLAFSTMFAIAAVPLARWADRGNRKWIINGCLVAWTLFTAASGAALNFTQLVLARVGVGIGEAGCVPASHSMLGDYFSRQDRPHALAVHMSGSYLGMLGGMLGGGILLQTVGWRAGFIWLGAIGLVMAVIFHFTVREPQRTHPETLADRPGIHVGNSQKGMLAQLGDMQAFAWLVMAFSTTSLAGSSIMVWLPSYFERAFHLTPVQIGIGLGLCLGVATAIGGITGGRLGVRKAAGSMSWGAKFSALNTVVVMPFFLASFIAPSPVLAFVMLFCAFLTAGMILGPVFSTLQDLVAPEARATAVALVSFFAVMVGQGLGPLAVGAISDALHTEAAGAGSLRSAMIIVACVNFFTILAFWQLKRRIDVLQAR
jgi:predicted MFS family arabinose efflux permease